MPEKVRSQYPVIPWREVRGMRNKLVHHYFGVNIEYQNGVHPSAPF
ncbi:MAG: HepT-like ribonuclease domain-containing protein [Chloroflexota bacterium]